MYQPYPSTDKPVEPDRPPAPQSVLSAVKLMYAGAAVSAVSLIVSLVSIGGTKDAIKKARPSLTAAQVNQLNAFIIALAVVSGVIGVALWLWMARKNDQGKNWARILSTVLFGLATLDLFGVFSQPKTVLGLVFPVLTWLIGLGAVILLWRRESTEFFKPLGRYDPSIDARVKPPSDLR
jgi:cytochrome bd-type quinol oxidase subunit 2